MIYLDSSAALAHLLDEERAPPASLWDEELVSSRLFEYEIWTRINSLGLAPTKANDVHAVLIRVNLIELSPPVLARALDPFPSPCRTLDALHLASADYLRAQGRRVEIASYDARLVAAARALGFSIAPL
ncbi:MAG: PIN domain-containing protein [Stellaceae bacterium]